MRRCILAWSVAVRCVDGVRCVASAPPRARRVCGASRNGELPERSPPVALIGYHRHTGMREYVPTESREAVVLTSQLFGELRVNHIVVVDGC